MRHRWGVELARARWRYERLKRLLLMRERREAANFDRFQIAFYDRFWREAARNIGAEVEPLGYDFLRIRKAGKWTLVYGHRVMLNDHLSLEMSRTKPLMHRLLQENGCRVPKSLEYDLTTIGRAQEFLRELRGSAVVKPASGPGGGEGVTTKIRNNDRLKKASLCAASLDWSLLIEEEVPGDSYRLLYLDGKLIDAVRRAPPTVTGDGRRSIRQLVRDETAERLRDPHLFRALIPLTIDLDCVFTLQEQGFTLRQVPAANQRLVVKTVINQNSGGENHRILEKVHPSLERLGSQLVTALGIPVVGLDLITSKIGAPLEEGEALINDISMRPFLHHHVLAAESHKKPPIGELILDYIFASSERCMFTSPLGKGGPTG